MKNISLILPVLILSAVISGCSPAQKQPEWQKAQVFAEKQDHPQALTTDGEFLYFITGGTMASLQEGTSGVWKMPLAGGQPIQLFKGLKKSENSVVLPDTFVLGLDEKYVYWSSGAIWRTPKNGGESEPLTNGMPTELSIDETKIYWHNFGGENSPPTPIYFADKAGGEAKPLTEPVITSGIVSEKDFIYWAQADGIYKIAKTVGEKSKIYSAPEKQTISGLIADKDNFYFTQGDGRNALFKVAKMGSEAVKIAPGINHAHKFYADETHIYFVVNESSFLTALAKVSKNGGEVSKIDSGYLASFTLAKDKIYVATVDKIYVLEK